MAVFYQFSGPSDEIKGFDAESLFYLRQDAQAVQSVLVIASDLYDYPTTDYYYKKNRPWFDRFIPQDFTIELLDGRKTIDEARALLSKADCIHLMGGYTEKQIELLSYFNISSFDLDQAQLVFGTSAGAMALGPVLMGTYDKNEVLKGLSCSPFVIWPHYEESDDEQINDLLETFEEILALKDDAGLRIDEDEIVFINQTYKLFKKTQ